MRVNKKALFLTLILLAAILQPFLAIVPNVKAGPGGMEQVIFGGNPEGPLDTVNTRYNTLHSGYSWITDEMRAWQVISTDGVIKNLRVVLDGAPGAGTKYTFTLRLNSAPTALTFDIADTDTSGSNMVTEITVTGGDWITLECDPDNTPTARNAFGWTCVFEGDNAKESLILGRAAGTLHRTETYYGQVMTCGTSLAANENDRRQVIPTSGKIKNFYVKLDIDPGTPPDSYRLTVRLNGATVAQSPIVTITANDKTGSDLVHNLDVVAGDYITMMVEPVSTPALWPYAAWGMTFEADIDGESIVIGGTYNGLDRWNTKYNKPSYTEGGGWGATEALDSLLGQVCTVKKFHMLLTAPPGAGKSWDFNLRIAGGDSNVLFTIADTDTTGDSGALEDTVALDEFVSLECDPTDVPDAADAYWGFVCYIEPPIPEFIENEGIEPSDSTVDDGQWFFLNASIEILPNTSTFLFNRIDIDPTGLNMSCSYTNGTGFSEENDPNNYLQLDVVVSVKMDLNNTFVRVEYYLRLHSNVTKDGIYNVTVYSTASGDLSDSDDYTSIFTLTIRAPSAPTLLFGAGFNASSPYVELHWTNNLEVVTFFEVQNSSNNVDWGYLGQNSTAQYTDSQVVNGTERYYKVRACRDTGVGWKNSSFTDSNFERVHFEIEPDVTTIMGGAGIFCIILIIIVPIVVYMVKRK